MNIKFTCIYDNKRQTAYPFKEIRIQPVRGVIHHYFATIHPYINTHLTHLMDCLVKCDELIVNMIGGSSHFDGYAPAPARQRPKQ